ncbi:G-protein coupled receptor GRL101-like [Pomacea canaliculata]|uniref:G-protein coupled receptor GRL101-like n=1 Tax=Pomacea canaliculata TaxID=400727 RepID=UPI000D727B80|nr:G-protein coupled receptor GRL101-like [Pomacea canaliculata]
MVTRRTIQTFCVRWRRTQMRTDQSSSSLLPARPTVSKTRGFRHCPMGHSTHDFLSCDATSACLVHTYGSVTACLESVTSLPPFFTCNNGFESVPYTLVCDYRRDCDDNSDEDFCVFPPCDNLKAYDCGNQQCIKQVEQCDGTEQCVNKADEQCGILQEEEEMTIVMNNPSPPVIVDIDHGKLLALEGPSDCPDTHFRCPGADVYCMPVFLLCNGVLDCPGHEDETMCSNYTCPGFFRCRGSIVCLHPDHVCDGHPQCPQQDDERLCSMACPANCSCNGLSFVCGGHFLVSDYPHLRYLDARGSGMSPSNVVNNIFLVYLNLANCNISRLIDLTLPNLQHLDLSNNSLTFFNDHTFSALINLRVLSMGGNLLSTFFMSSVSWKIPLHTVLTLDISRISLKNLNS